MKILIRALLFFVCDSLMTIFALYYAGYELDDIVYYPRMFLIYPSIAILLGLFLGLFFYLVIQFSKFIKSFYALGLNVSLLIYFIWTLFYLYDTHQFNKIHGYNGKNQLMLSDIENTERKFVGLAFERLQSRFSFPRNVRLINYYFQTNDTVINNYQDTSRTVYFTYALSSDIKTKRFSKVFVFHDITKLQVFNALTDTSLEYSPIKKKTEEDEKERKRVFDEILKLVPDSLRGKIHKY